MSIQKLISDYIKYNSWANKRMVDWLKTLDRNLLSKPVQSSFGSIELTLQHINSSQNFWFAVITETDLSKEEDKRDRSIESLMEDLIMSSEKMVDTFTKYTENELLMKVKSPVMSQSRYDFILHVVNHSSYHRGQVINISRLLGITENIPETDYETYLWFQQKKAEDKK